MRDLATELLQWHAAGKDYALATIIGVTGSAPRPAGAALAVDAEGAVVGSISGGCVEGAVYELCREVLRTGQPIRESFGYSNDDGVFAAGLTCGGTLCDARPVFATRARFPDADEIVVQWPDRYLTSTQVDSRTVVCVLTHDTKFDIPLLEAALRLPVAYVGAMGSRRTHDDRMARLRAAGMTETELAHLHSPIGLDLGGRTAEETAVAIAAEIVAVRLGGSARPLTSFNGPIHRDRIAVR